MNNNGIIYGNPKDDNTGDVLHLDTENRFNESDLHVISSFGKTIKNDLEKYVLGTTYFAREHSNLWLNLMTQLHRKPAVISRVRSIFIRQHTGNTFRENAASLTLEPSEVMFWNCLGYNAYDTTIKVYTHPISMWQQLYRNRPTKNKSFFKR
jgi:hypothetical protein